MFAIKFQDGPGGQVHQYKATEIDKMNLRRAAQDCLDNPDNRRVFGIGSKDPGKAGKGLTLMFRKAKLERLATKKRLRQLIDAIDQDNVFQAGLIMIFGPATISKLEL